MILRLQTEMPVALVVCILLAGIGCKHPAAERAFEDEVRDSLGSAKFDKTKLDDNVRIVVSSGSGRRFFTRENIENFHADAQEKGEAWEPSNFKVLKKDVLPDSRYASITYEVTWKLSTGRKPTNSTHLVSREIWEHQVDGWHRLFAAMDQ